MPTSDGTLTPQDPLSLFSLDLPVPSVPVLLGEKERQRATGKGTQKGGDKSSWAPDAQSNVLLEGRVYLHSGTIHQAAGNICHE